MKTNKEEAPKKWAATWWMGDTQNPDQDGQPSQKLRRAADGQIAGFEISQSARQTLSETNELSEQGCPSWSSFFPGENPSTEEKTITNSFQRSHAPLSEPVSNGNVPPDEPLEKNVEDTPERAVNNTGKTTSFPQGSSRGSQPPTPLTRSSTVSGGKTSFKKASKNSGKEEPSSIEPLRSFHRRVIKSTIREEVQADREYLILGVHRLRLERDKEKFKEEQRKKWLQFHVRLAFYLNHYVIVLSLMGLTGLFGVIIGVNVPEAIACRNRHTPCWHLRLREGRIIQGSITPKEIKNPYAETT